MPELNDAFICEPVRSPVGRYGGALRDVPAAVLASTVLSALVARTGLTAADDVLFGQCYPSGEAPAIGRVAALDAGLDVSTSGLQLDRRCGSGLQAVLFAAMQIQTGVSDVVIAGGVDSMSQAEYYTTAMRWGARAETQPFHDRLSRARVTAGGVHHPIPGGMVETAENLRREFGIGRDAQDELATSSHQRAVAAQQAGRFDDELVPVPLPRGGTCSVDEHPRADTTVEVLAALRPVMKNLDGATVTAGNSSGQNDGAAACIVASAAAMQRHGLRPLARLVGWASAGLEPERMGLGPVAATARALERSGLTLNDLDVIELNEAFAAQVLACLGQWRVSPEDERLNVNGSGISLGHPVGATGGRILATMLRELDRREGRYALETMCIGGGQGLAAIFERVA